MAYFGGVGLGFVPFFHTVFLNGIFLWLIKRTAGTNQFICMVEL